MSTEIPGEWATHPDRNCAHRHADDWFPTDSRATQYASTLCAGCPVAAQCLRYAVERPELVGIWGGTTETQRDWLRKKAVA